MDPLSVTVASLVSLAVYIAPLLALLISFDAVAGEVERGTLPLHLAYPLSRGELLLGKLLAQLAALTLAVVAGYAAAGAAAFAAGGAAAAEGLPALWRLTWTTVLLGATFLSLGHALSCASRFSRRSDRHCALRAARSSAGSDASAPGSLSGWPLGRCLRQLYPPPGRPPPPPPFDVVLSSRAAAKKAVAAKKAAARKSVMNSVALNKRRGTSKVHGG